MIINPILLPQRSETQLLYARPAPPLEGQHQHDQRLLRGAERGGGGAQVPGPQEEEEAEGDGEPRQWDQLPVHLALHD